MYSSRYSCTSSSGHGAAAGTDRVQAAAPPEGKPLAREPHGWAARWLAGCLLGGWLAGRASLGWLAGWLAVCLSVEPIPKCSTFPIQTVVSWVSTDAVCCAW